MQPFEGTQFEPIFSGELCRKVPVSAEKFKMDESLMTQEF